MRVFSNDDYLMVLKGIAELPFSVGKKLLFDFLSGDIRNDSVSKNRLDELDSFGTLAYDQSEFLNLLESLLSHNLVTYNSVNNKRYYKVLELTMKGRDELINPKLNKEGDSIYSSYETNLSPKEKLAFDIFKDFLGNLNDLQKKAVICDAQTCLCVAGAGSGKTTV